MSESELHDEAMTSIAGLDSEIARLNALSDSYTAAQALIKDGKYPVDTSTKPPAIPAPTVPKVLDAEKTVKPNFSALYAAEGSSGGVQPPPAPTDKIATDTSSSGITQAQKTLADARAALFKSQQDRDVSAADWDSYDMATIADDAAKQVGTWITAKQNVITSRLAALATLRATKAASCPPTVSIITGATAPEAGDRTSTTISFSFSAADRNKVAKSKDTRFSTGSSVGFALQAAGGSYSHDSAHSSMQDHMASCDAEIFDGADLGIAADVLLSPGASRLKTAIATQETKLNPEFPAYPTSFILAADRSIDFTGSTRHIQEYFNSKTTSSDASVGWGPFSSHVSSHHSSSHSHVQCHTTATGCKLSFGASQIIAWVSEILPELPRAKNLNPLWQGAHPAASG
nr:hypothetical protein FVER53263_12570 [Fusarium verticillioides]